MSEVSFSGDARGRIVMTILLESNTRLEKRLTQIGLIVHPLASRVVQWRMACPGRKETCYNDTEAESDAVRDAVFSQTYPILEKTVMVASRPRDRHIKTSPGYYERGLFLW